MDNLKKIQALLDKMHMSATLMQEITNEMSINAKKIEDEKAPNKS